MASLLSFRRIPDEADLGHLAARANAIRAKLPLQTPIIVEFAGSPKSGKSTNIDIVDHFFRRSGFKVWAPTEGASKRTPYNLRKDLVAFNAWSLNYAISELLLSYHNVDMPHLVILDRGPYDSLAWMGVLRDRGDLSPEEYGIIQNFALHPKWATLIDRIYLFTCKPEISLKRENALKLRVRSPGLAMNTDMLSQLLAQYRSLQTALSTYPVVGVSTDDTDGDDGPRSTAFAIVTDLLDCFSKKLGIVT